MIEVDGPRVVASRTDEELGWDQVLHRQLDPILFRDGFVVQFIKYIFRDHLRLDIYETTPIYMPHPYCRNTVS